MNTATAGTTFRRDVRVISLIGGAHLLSHFFQLVLPPLFPLLREEFGVSYTALGLLTMTMFLASGVSQPVAGFLVDRYGARPVLLAGLAVFAGSIAAIGLAPSFWVMFPLIALAGLGNAVFHPADFAILNASVEPKRLGRAYGVHGISGNIGWVAAPAASLSLSALFGWRAALVTLGCLGLAATIYLASQRHAMTDHRRPKTEAAKPTTLSADLRMLMAPYIVMSFVFFALLSMALIGVQTFVSPALMEFHNFPLAEAATALTVFLGAGIAGTMVGGVIADRIRRPGAIMMLCLAAFAAIFLTLAIPGLPHLLVLPILAVTGALLGAAGPPRDMLVRDRTPVGSSGKIYGFVYAGLDAGAAVMPPVFGWLMDVGTPRAIFVLISAVIALSVLTVLQIQRQPTVVTAA
jgi:MFS transporter, FSR family, fosmidomycin resistance protein